MFLVLHESVFSVPIMSRTVCVTVSRGNKMLTDGLSHFLSMLFQRHRFESCW